MASLDLEREKTGGRYLMRYVHGLGVRSFFSLNLLASIVARCVACITAACPGLQVATVSTTCCPPQLDTRLL